MDYRVIANCMGVGFIVVFLGSMLTGDREIITSVGMVGVPVWMVQLLLWRD